MVSIISFFKVAAKSKIYEMQEIKEKFKTHK